MERDNEDLVYNYNGFIESMKMYCDELINQKIVGIEDYETAKMNAIIRVTSSLRNGNVEDVENIVSILEKYTNIIEILD